MGPCGIVLDFCGDLKGNLHNVLQMKEKDVLKFLAVGTHLGGTNLDFQMK